MLDQEFIYFQDFNGNGDFNLTYQRGNILSYNNMPKIQALIGGFSSAVDLTKNPICLDVQVGNLSVLEMFIFPSHLKAQVDVNGFAYKGVIGNTLIQWY